MAEKRKPKLSKNTDKAQSEQFKKVARELEADGELNLTDAEKRFEKALDKLKPKAPTKLSKAEQK
ncbi:hypothetical protein [Hyphococcus lacteus]|uniref:Uncharacterized protein n=1 Tax=Hyphococcus lacteus TaxID=3143536 RepID=A0ABV3Z5G0_9PROT